MKPPRFSEEELMNMKRGRREVGVSRSAVPMGGHSRDHAQAAISPSSLSAMETAVLPADKVRGLKRQQAGAESGDRDVSPVRPSPYKRVAVNIKGPFVFTLPMQIPSGKNAVQITRTGKRYPNKRFKEWREEAIQALPAQRPCFGDPVGLHANYTPGDNIRRDVPGLLDALCHLIEHVGIVLDDAQVKNVDWTTFPAHKGKATCEVQIYELYQGVRHAKKD